MKIVRRIIVLFFIAFIIIVGISCQSNPVIGDYGAVLLEEHFDSMNTSQWHAADGWTNGGMFNCTWYQEQITFSKGIMTLTLEEDKGNGPPYKSGEYRTNDFYGYGLYEVRMKATKNIGVVSSFFTYTGPSDDNPWDEIDIEFLGKDTTEVQFNYFTDGVGNHEYVHSLEFDASENFHTYAFEWLPTRINWYIDGDKVHTATMNIPDTPGKIMMNLWPGSGVDGWLGAYDHTRPLTAQYDWVKFTQYKSAK